MPIISPTLPNDGETIDAQDVNGPFNAILGVLNGNIDDQNVKPGSLPWSVMDSFSNQIPASAMQDSGNLENFRADAKISFIPSGLIWSATTGLAAGMTSGEYYSNSGILLPITAITSRTFTASRDTYVSIAQNGSIAYSEVTNGAAQPSLPSNSNWLAKVVTNGSAVTSVTDMRQTAPIASHNVDFTTQGKIWWEEVGRASLGSNASSIGVTLSKSYKHLKVIFMAAASGGTFMPGIRFNNDNATNYNHNILYNNSGTATYTTEGTKSEARIGSTIASGADFYTVIEIVNPSGKSNFMNNITRQDPSASASSGFAIGMEIYNGKWVNTALATSIQIVKVTGTGNLASGSEIVVIGHD